MLFLKCHPPWLLRQAGCQGFTGVLPASASLALYKTRLTIWALGLILECPHTCKAGTLFTELFLQHPSFYFSVVLHLGTGTFYFTM